MSSFAASPLAPAELEISARPGGSSRLPAGVLNHVQMLHGEIDKSRRHALRHTASVQFLESTLRQHDATLSQHERALERHKALMEQQLVTQRETQQQANMEIERLRKELRIVEHRASQHASAGTRSKHLVDDRASELALRDKEHREMRQSWAVRLEGAMQKQAQPGPS